MRERTLKESVPPIIPIVVGLFTLVSAFVHAHTGKMRFKLGIRVDRTVDPNNFQDRLILEFVIALLFLALWMFEISQ